MERLSPVQGQKRQYLRALLLLGENATMRSRVLLLGLSAVTVGFTGRVQEKPLSASTPAGDAVTVSAPTPAPEPVAPVENNRTALVSGALEALAPRVTRSSHSDALRMAFNAYFSYRLENPDEVRNPYFYFVDYGLDNRTPRGYVFNMETLELVDGPFIVAHGRGSASGKNAVPMRFTNRPGSASTSLGLYVTQETYGFSGK